MRTLFIPSFAVAVLSLGIGNASTTWAQSNCNLVTNGDFEAHGTLSGSINNVGRIGSTPGELPNWTSPNGNTPDYYSNLAPYMPTDCSNPNYAPFGTFGPYNGDGSLGILAMQYVNNSYYYSEYVTQTLPQSLAFGAQAPVAYYASMQVRSASNGSNATKVGLSLSSAALGNAGHYPGTAFGAYSPGVMPSLSWQRVANIFNASASDALQYVTVGNFEAFPYTISNVRTAQYDYAYLYIDDVKVCKIPTAGPPQTAACGPVTIGEGCDIPEATYAWTIQGSSAPPFATTLTTSVTQTATTTYVLTVTLPTTGNLTQTSVSTVTVTGKTLSAPVEPQVSLLYDDADCKGQEIFQITNYDPSYTYSFTRYGVACFLDAGGQVRVKSSNSAGSFSVTATGCGTSATSEVYEANFCTDPIHEVRPAKAYPNPANESLTLPEGVTNATLLNSQGQVVGKLDATGRLEIRHLPAGLYNLRMQQNGKRVNQHIEIKH